MKHNILKCDCDKPHCHICQGGLEFCTVCKGAESSLTTDCCGSILSDSQQYAVSCGDDFVQGKWKHVYIHG